LDRWGDNDICLADDVLAAFIENTEDSENSMRALGADAIGMPPGALDVRATEQTCEREL
jgi:hypothetical protein